MTSRGFQVLSPPPRGGLPLCLSEVSSPQVQAGEPFYLWETHAAVGTNVLRFVLGKVGEVAHDLHAKQQVLRLVPAVVSAPILARG